MLSSVKEELSKNKGVILFNIYNLSSLDIFSLFNNAFTSLTSYKDPATSPIIAPNIHITYFHINYFL